MPRIVLILCATGLSFLAFVSGYVVRHFESFPHSYLRNALIAAEALFIQRTGREAEADIFVGARSARSEDFSRPPVRDELTGIRRYDPEQAYSGFTIYSGNSARYPIRLVDMDGNSVHEWTLPVEELYGERSDGLDLASGPLFNRRPYLLPNGDLLIVVIGGWQTPWGWALVKLDKDSRLLWAYTKQTHHDLTVDNNGNIYTLLHSIISQQRPGLEKLVTPYLDDYIAILSPDGQEIKTISILDAIYGSNVEAVLAYIDPDPVKGDLLHANSLEVITPAIAALWPFAEAGQILVSLRNSDLLMVIDPATEKAVWALRGPWRMQHDPDLLANGRILIFDNRGDLQNDGHSRVIEFDPLTQKITWEFPGNTGELLYSSVKASAQRLPNGNTLITESNNGRLLEVTSKKQVVWEYFIPERHTSNTGATIAQVQSGERFSADELDFEFNRRHQNP